MTYKNTCSHGETEPSVVKRWGAVETVVNNVPADDRLAQLTAIWTCSCCTGPARAETCTRCQA